MRFSRPFFEPELAAIRGLHGRFAKDLPQLATTPVNTIFIGAAPVGGLPGAPVTMAAYKKDGTFETRLQIQGDLLIINFLLYTHWSELWPKAQLWASSVLDAARTVGLPDGTLPIQITSVLHQMIDAFVWEGESANVSVQALFSSMHSRLPGASWDAKGLGWFAAHSTNEAMTDADIPQSVLVDWLACDLSDEPGLGWRLRLENTLEVRFAQSLPPLALFSGDLATKLMNDLHARNNFLVKSLLRADMLRRIGMEAPL
jgi:hypothetical protein